jgi:Ca-activated chloride channel family protein
MIRFAEPLWFFLLIPVVLIFLGQQRTARLRFSSIELLKELTGGSTLDPRIILKILRALALVLCIVAMARPQAGKSFSEARSDGVDIIIAMDTSDSMRAMDFFIDNKRVTRLDILKQVVADFVKKRPNDRIGLVVFGEEAYVQCPLTLDHGIVLDFVQKTEIGVAGADATAIGSAIAASVARLKDLKAKEKIVILTTDGENNAGRISPLVAADVAKTLKAKVYAVGIGTEGGAPILVNTLLGPTYQQTQFSIDEKLLKEIASRTGGRYFRAKESKKLAEIYNEIDRLEKTEVKVKEYTEYEELFHFALIAALIVLLTEIVLAHTLLRKIP